MGDEPIDRRTLIRRTAKIGTAGALIWVAPAVVDVPVAAATDLHSTPPQPPRSPVPPRRPEPPPDTQQRQPASSGGGSLPFTGNEELRNAEVGAAIAAAGAAGYLIAGHRRPALDEGGAE